MKLSQKMEQELNRQLQEELNSAYIYSAMAIHLEATFFKGMSTWMVAQEAEERAHALKFLHYIQERGSAPKLLALPEPQAEWASPLALFEAALAHEQHITKRIELLANLAADERDFATANFLQWFINEQVEEEATLEPIIHRLKLSGDNVAALYQLDRELGMRGGR